MALLAHSVSMGVRSTRIPHKVFPKYKPLLDLILTREKFELCQRQIEEISLRKERARVNPLETGAITFATCFGEV